MAEAKQTTKKPAKKTAKKTAKKRASKTSVVPASRGIAADAVTTAQAPDDVTALADQVRADGGTVLAVYQEPLGSNWTILAALPLTHVEPTPFQRDLSAAHVKRLTGVIDTLDRFLDPIVTVRNEATSNYWTPNGNHRLNAMRNLGAKSIIALVVPETRVAYKILALNTEKAHNVKEKALEVIRMARSLADLDPRAEGDFAMEFEDPYLLTLGACYERNARFSGGAYAPVLKRVESFLQFALPEAIGVREARAQKLLTLDEAVGEAVAALKARGFDNPYLRPFVVARINPLRFKRGEAGDFDEVIDGMLASAQTFDASKVRADQIAATPGAASE